MNKKIIAFALAAAFTFSMVGPAIADAATLEEQIAELLAKIVSLEAQIAGQTTPAATAVCFNNDLSKGMTSNDVKNLQIVLNKDTSTQVASSGAGSPGNETTYFGSLTLAAVKTFQTSNGIINTGYVGPLTRGALNALYCTASVPSTTYPAGCTSAVGYSTTTGLLCSEVTTFPEGCTSAVGFSPTTGLSCAGTTTTTVAVATEGYFTYKLLASPTNGTDVKKGDINKALMAFTLKANNSPITVQSIRLNFNKRPWLNVSKIALYEGANLVREVEAVSSAFEEATVGSSYNLYLTNLGISISKDETKTFTVKVDVSASPVAIDLTQVQLADTTAIRGVDSTSLNVYAPSAASARTFTIAAAANGYIDVALNTGSPVQGTALVSDTETTENVVLGKFDLKAKYKDIRATGLIFTFVGVTTEDMDTVLSAAKLYDGDTLLATEALDTDASKTTGSVSFTLLDIPIVKDATKVLTLKANVAKLDTSYTTAGDYVHAVLDGTAVANITAEDSLYHTLTNTELDGTATTENQYFYVKGPTFAFIQATEARSDYSSSSPSDVGDFSIKFSVTANGGDVYLPTVDHATYSSGNTDDNGILQTITPVADTTSATTTYWSCEGSNSLDDLTTLNVWAIPNGMTRNCTFNLHIRNTNATAYYNIGLTNIKWSLTGSATVDFTTQNWGISDLKTGTILLQSN
jgi:hypothetical protein